MRWRLSLEFWYILYGGKSRSVTHWSPDSTNIHHITGTVKMMWWNVKWTWKTFSTQSSLFQNNSHKKDNGNKFELVYSNEWMTNTRAQKPYWTLTQCHITCCSKKTKKTKKDEHKIDSLLQPLQTLRIKAQHCWRFCIIWYVNPCRNSVRGSGSTNCSPNYFSLNVCPTPSH